MGVGQDQVRRGQVRAGHRSQAKGSDLTLRALRSLGRFRQGRMDTAEDP